MASSSFERIILLYVWSISSRACVAPKSARASKFPPEFFPSDGEKSILSIVVLIPNKFLSNYIYLMV